MLIGNAITQACTPTAAAHGALTLTAVAGYQTFAGAFGTGASARPFLYTIRRNADSARIECGIGRILVDGTLSRDTVLDAWDGTTATAYPAAPTVLAAGAAYTVECADSDSSRAVAPQLSDAGISGSKFLIGANWLASPSASIAPGADTLHLVAFELERPVLCSGVSLLLKTAATAGAVKEVRAALYVQDHAGRLAVPIAETASVSVASGLTRKDMFFASPVRLIPSWLGVAICTDSDAFFAGSNAPAAQKVCPLWGVSSGSPTARYSRMTRPLAYASTGSLFPNLTGAAASTYGNDSGGANPVCPMLIVA